MAQQVHLDGHGERLDADGHAWQVAGVKKAVRRDQRTQLDADPGVPPVETSIIVATARVGNAVCLVVHRPLDAATSPAEAVVGSLRLEAPDRS